MKEKEKQHIRNIPIVERASSSSRSTSTTTQTSVGRYRRRGCVTIGPTRQAPHRAAHGPGVGRGYTSSLSISGTGSSSSGRSLTNNNALTSTVLSGPPPAPPLPPTRLGSSGLTTPTSSSPATSTSRVASRPSSASGGGRHMAGASGYGGELPRAKPVAVPRGRRWLLRRAAGRKDGGAVGLAVADDETRKDWRCDDGVATGEDELGEEEGVLEGMSTEVHGENEEIGHVEEEEEEEVCGDEEEEEEGVEEEEDDEEEDGVGDEDAEGDLDVRSMDASAAQSETASTVSRVALSVSDKAELEGRDVVVVGGMSSTTARANGENNGNASGISGGGRRGGRDKMREQLRAAFVRELMLSSLGL